MCTLSSVTFDRNELNAKVERFAPMSVFFQSELYHELKSACDLNFPIQDNEKARTNVACVRTSKSINTIQLPTQ